MKRIVLFLKGNIEYLPPVVNAIKTLSSLRKEIALITESCSDALLNEFHQHGIMIQRQYHSPCGRTKNPFAKIRQWLNFRSFAWKTYNTIAKPDDLLWIGSADTTLALGKRLFHHKFVLHIHELYDTFPRYRNGLKAYAKSALAVVVPEMSRASVFRVWWDLKQTPFVVPNKPFGYPRVKNLEITDVKIRKQIAEIGETPIVLYQGHIEKGRTLDIVAKAIHDHNLPVRFVLMGKDHGNFIDHLTKLCPNLVNLGFVTPPHHLEVTSHALMGIIQYNFSCLNHVFCAPNKIWEYSGFGVPALAADLPALRYYYDRYHAGICCNFDSEKEVVYAINTILKKKEEYSSGAMRLFDSCELQQLYGNILNELTSRFSP